MESNEARRVTPLATTVSARVGALLRRDERSQAWLARKIDRSAQWLHYRMSGRTPWLVNDLQLVADALDVEVATLLVDDDEDADDRTAVSA